MAKVRVRALQRGYDGYVRREPGDEFDYDIKLQGQGKWFELVNEPIVEHKQEAETVTKPKRGGRRKSKDVDDLLA